MITVLIVLAGIYGYALCGSYTGGRIAAGYGPDNVDALPPAWIGGVCWPFTAAWWLVARALETAAKLGPRALFDRGRARGMLPEARARYLSERCEP